MIRKLAWDSDFFGISMAHLDHGAYEPANRSEFERIAAEDRIQFIQALIPIQDAFKIRELEDAGFRFADLRVTFQADSEGLTGTTTGSGEFLLASGSADEEELCRYAPSLFKDSRYYGYENLFRDSDIERMYALWVRKAIRGTMDDHCFKFVLGGEAVGFVTVKIRDESAAIGLIGVRPDHRRHGIGSALLRGLAGWLAARGISRLIVATQGKNVQAQNFYLKNGFRIRSLEAWYYRFDDERNIGYDSVQ